MKKILIFGGTTEGRELAVRLAAAGIKSELHVATEYGEQVMEENDNITVIKGRLNTESMKALFASGNYYMVADCTHPFATEVSVNISLALKECGLSGIRVTRNTENIKTGDILYFDDKEECREALLKTEGNILLTTGSKDLSFYAEISSLKKRLYARVLPGIESIELCYAAGLEGKNIIAMQGPFSIELNEAILRQYDISIIVSKESGQRGGVDEKILAAANAGVPCYIIRKPMEKAEESSLIKLTEEEAFFRCLEEAGISKGSMNIILAGTGMDGVETLTEEARRAIEKADYVFGAPRLTDKYVGYKKVYPYYLEEDILPVLHKIAEDRKDTINIVILFSGDTGFYSGSQKLSASLNKKGISVRIIPGISTISALAARTGISWDDGFIMSTHGIKTDVWEGKLLQSVRYNSKTFSLTSGDKDVRRIGQLLCEAGLKDVTVYLGYRLYYEDEKLYKLKASELESIAINGLYAVLIVNEGPDKRELTPHLTDETFQRDRVPMTKEEIRHLSVCKLRVNEGDVIYDIGCGTGSVTAEIASLSDDITVYAFECKDEAFNLSQDNITALGLNNVRIFKGMAPEILKEAPPADKAFIGGSRGNLKVILDKLYEINKNMRIVMNAVSMESISDMQRLIKEYPVRDTDIVQIQVNKTKKAGDYNMLTASNPVFIFSFTFSEHEEA